MSDNKLLRHSPPLKHSVSHYILSSNHFCWFVCACKTVWTKTKNCVNNCVRYVVWPQERKYLYNLKVVAVVSCVQFVQFNFSQFQLVFVDIYIKWWQILANFVCKLIRIQSSFLCFWSQTNLMTRAQKSHTKITTLNK